MYKILYVEDEAFLAKIVKESLERLGHEVYHVSDGAYGVKAFREFEPDICVLDIMLPNQNGYEIAEGIRQLNIQIPIIFLTAKSQTKDLVTGFQAGGNDYIKKPFSMEELVLRINNLMQIFQGITNKEERTLEYKLSSFHFYPVKQQLVRIGITKTLSYKESQILELFCEHINASVERKEILMKVWGDDSYFNSRNLDVYIRKLRKYLSDDSSVKIVTLKGIGYSFLVG